MHPRQASVLAEAQAVVAALSGKTVAAANPMPTTGPVVLWKYVDTEGNVFFLETKRTTIKSPFSGKSFTVRPERYTPSEVGKELKDERKEQSKNAREDLVAYVNRLAAQPMTLWQYGDPEGNKFWLDRRITTSIRSPYGGPAFTPKPKKVMPSQIGKILKEEAKEQKAEDTKMSDADDPNDLKAFAAKALKVALSPQCKKYHDDRAFIGSVKDLGFPSMDRAKFDSMLIEAHRARLLRLTRADLVQAMDPHDVEHSDVHYQGATFNFIALDDHLPPIWDR